LNNLLIPPPTLGWSIRSKTRHFTYYKAVCESFGTRFGIDPWEICPLFSDCTDIDFIAKKGIDAIIEKSHLLLKAIQVKYDEYDIKHKPFVMIKTDAGTYGMAIMSLNSPEDLNHLNRKQRTNMSVRKGGHPVNHVIIQEGVYTFETVGLNQLVAEPVLYMIGQYVVGGFYRVHQSRDINENLNSPGMHFEKLSFSQTCINPDNQLKTHPLQNHFYVYSVIARLGHLATCYERDKV